MTTRRDALGLATTAGAALSLTACGGGDEGESTAPSGPVRVPVSDIPEGGGVVRDGVVVVQPAQGEFRAYGAECPHQGCSVGEVTTTAIVCPCHGSTFDPASGDVTQGPATEGLSTRKATVDGDEVVVS